MGKTRSRIEKLEQATKPTTVIQENPERTNCWVEWVLSQPEEEFPEAQLERLQIELEAPATSQGDIWRNEFRRESIVYLETTLAGKPWPPPPHPCTPSWLVKAGRAIRDSLGLTIL